MHHVHREGDYYKMNCSIISLSLPCCMLFVSINVNVADGVDISCDICIGIYILSALSIGSIQQKETKGILPSR